MVRWTAKQISLALRQITKLFLPIIATKSDDFTPEEAAALLTSEVEEKIIAFPPCLPKAGEAYLFCPDGKRNTSKFNLHALTIGLYSHLVRYKHALGQMW